MEIVHTLSRGVDKRKIFLDKQDYLRFIHDLFEFNDATRANNVAYHFDILSRRIVRSDNRSRSSAPRKLLVRLHAFCLMPNHYHLLLSRITEGGVSRFMRKINVGYAKYFNQKYERKGTLFEGRYKSVSIANEQHLLHIPYYIHLNPLDLVAPEWRRRELSNYRSALDFLKTYRWSSFLDYIGRENFPSVTQRNFLTELLGGPKNIERDVVRWLKEMNLESLERTTLE